jgi:hypothetical protein
MKRFFLAAAIFFPFCLTGAYAILFVGIVINGGFGEFWNLVIGGSGRVLRWSAIMSFLGAIIVTFSGRYK